MLKKSYPVVFSTLIALLIGGIMLLQCSATILTTSVKLIVLNDNISYYNENPRKTDEMTEKVLKEYEKREAIYNSEDTVVRVFSNLPGLVKGLVAIIALASFVVIPFVYFITILDAIKYHKWRKRKAHQKQK